MPEGLLTADGRAIDLENVDVDRQFAAAMAAPPADDPEAPAPPDVPPFDPEAPYGRKIDGTPKVRPGGRPPKERPRTTTKAAAAAADPKGKPAEAKPDYAEGLKEFFGGIALGLAVIPVPKDETRIRIRLQGAVLKETGDGLATGLGITAEHNGIVRWGVEKVTAGGGAWIFPAALAIMPFAIQTRMLWKAPVDIEMRELADDIEESALAEFKAQMGLITAVAETGQPETTAA